VSLDTLLGPVTTVVCLAILLSLVLNLRTVRRLDSVTTEPDPLRTVSLLVPARNEVVAIADCLVGLLAQTHPAVEIVVLDDRSHDGTADVVRSFADPRVRLVEGEELPDGWTGKNWACHQLSRVAHGEVLCFVDADTVLAPDAVRAALGLMQEEEADLVTSLVAAEYRNASEATLLPMVNHALLALFPVWLMHRRSFPRVALGLGPFIMVTRAAYADAGGHAAAPGHVVDDVTLCRSVKRAGGTVRLANGASMLRTRWYTNVGDIWRGFSKNAFGALDSNVLIAAATVFVLVPLLCVPFVRVGTGVLDGSLEATPLVQVLLLLAARTITSVVGRDPLWTVPLHPFTVLFWGATLAWSVVLTTTDRTVEWRGRPVAVRSRGT
jgi:chlorobactene glucosyltransferase